VGQEFYLVVLGFKVWKLEFERYPYEAYISQISIPSKSWAHL